MSILSNNVAALVRAIILLGLLAAGPYAAADSWSYPPTRTEKVFTFGDTKIVLITDATGDRQYPDFIFQVFKKGELQSQVHNIWFEQVFPSADRTLFVGLSNRGLPGPAVVVFNDRGAITLLASHGIAEFDYCAKSVTIQRDWYDAEDPQVTFHSEAKVPGSAGISLRDCRGRVVDLADVVLKAYSRAYTMTMRTRRKKIRR